MPRLSFEHEIALAEDIPSLSSERSRNDEDDHQKFRTEIISENFSFRRVFRSCRSETDTV